MFQGKRTTDLIVEKDRCLKQLQEVQSQLVEDVSKLHQLRSSYFEIVLHTYIETQVTNPFLI